MRQAIPVVAPRQPRRPGHHGLKLAVGVVVLLWLSAVCAVMGLNAFRSVGEGERLSVDQRFIEGEGERFTDPVGLFSARFPTTPGPRSDRVTMFGGTVDLRGYGSKVDDLSVGVSWFDLGVTPKPDEAAGVLSGVAVYLANDQGAVPENGQLIEGAEWPTYSFTINLPPVEQDPEPIVILRRIVLVDNRVYLLRVSSAEARNDMLRYFASTFDPKYSAATATSAS